MYIRYLLRALCRLFCLLNGKVTSCKGLLHSYLDKEEKVFNTLNVLAGSSLG